MQILTETQEESFTGFRKLVMNVKILWIIADESEAIFTLISS